MSKDKNAPAEGEETEAKGGKKKLIIILAVVLLAAAGAAYFFLFASSGEAEAEVPPPEHGGYTALEPVAVNLAGGGYLKIGVTLEYTLAAAGDGHGAGGVDGAKAYDKIISTFSQAQPADVVGAREALKEALEEKIIEAYTEEVEGEAPVQMVMGIYYTEYVTQ
ncbi:flagellar basal body-associated FliL family protein [Blastococcus sp. LR1]|uniref:flagellar basal body-associated FliL family protein n=1 Tax=Blastococcus sp. LR1 TaxID=2877000 RepID=UPI001CCB5BDA|nr:flagellar basal body-associated FliL family protein [Blastococcus sp. LR1]MCA0144501.1 flagellar basal body-associated FliL family protein [Blastococcus sp. LR1]